jgi:hypothetical protein
MTRYTTPPESTNSNENAREPSSAYPPLPQRHAKFGSDSNLQIDQGDDLEDRVCIDRLFMVV